ncbi:UNVERIFIED_CONTAM: hypothetical protein ABIC26_002495 [Paenibacillus sp. PvR008]
MQVVTLENGRQAYYHEETSQSLWWESENGFLARFVYYIQDNSVNLDDKKLDKNELIKLADRVQ